MNTLLSVLSSDLRQCELAVDAVHKQSDGGGGGGQLSPPKIEDITDTMIFSPTDLVTMTCHNVDLSFAVRGNETHKLNGRRLQSHQTKKRIKDVQMFSGDRFIIDMSAVCVCVCVCACVCVCVCACVCV